jgi:hypothetical protein
MTIALLCGAPRREQEQGQERKLVERLSALTVPEIRAFERLWTSYAFRECARGLR